MVFLIVVAECIACGCLGRSDGETDVIAVHPAPALGQLDLAQRCAVVEGVGVQLRRVQTGNRRIALPF